MRRTAARPRRLLRADAALQPGWWASQGRGLMPLPRNRTDSSGHLGGACMLFWEDSWFHFLPSEGLSFWSCLQIKQLRYI